MPKSPRARGGQISIYILLAVVILAVFSIYLQIYLQRQGSTITQPLEQLTIAPEDYLAEVKSIANDCLQESTVSTILDIGLQGRLELKKFVQLYDGTIETMSIDGQPLLPSVETLATETSTMINEETDSCLSRAFLKGDQLYETKAGETQARVTFSERMVQVEARIPIEVMVNDRSYAAEQFSASIPLRFPLVYSVAAQLVSLAQDDPSKVSVEDIIHMPLPVSIITLDATHYVYEIHDPESILDGQPFLYRFGVSFTGDRR